MAMYSDSYDRRESAASFSQQIPSGDNAGEKLNKVNSVCDRVRSAFFEPANGDGLSRERQEALFTAVLSTYVRQSPARFDLALATLKRFSAGSYVFLLLRWWDVSRK